MCLMCEKQCSLYGYTLRYSFKSNCKKNELTNYSLLLKMRLECFHMDLIAFLYEVITRNIHEFLFLFLHIILLISTSSKPSCRLAVTQLKSIISYFLATRSLPIVAHIRKSSICHANYRLRS